MNLIKNDISSFAIAVLNTYDLSKIKVDRKVALSFLENQILEEFKDLNSIETMKARHQHFKVGDAEDYAEYILEINEEKKVICGIRHFGGNPELPFINCIPNFKIDSTNEARFVAKKICSKFVKFNPLYLSFWSPKDIEIDVKGSVYLVTNITSFREPQNWKLDDRINLEQITDNSYYDWYKSGYEQFHLERPELKTKVTTNGLDVMSESFDQGLLFFAKLNQDKIGLIAGIKSEFLGHSGLYFNEIFISKEFRGKGLAKSIQRKFIIDKANSEVIIWGTVDYQNKYSYRTAIANGREPIRYECFLSLSRETLK